MPRIRPDTHPSHLVGVASQLTAKVHRENKVEAEDFQSALDLINALCHRIGQMDREISSLRSMRSRMRF